MNNEKRCHFVVTGGNGYIGSHLCRLLVSLGHQVSIIDDYSSSPSKNIHPFGTFFKGDISDAILWNKIAEAKVDAVFHFAAKAIVSESQLKPLDYFDANVAKTIKMLENMTKLGITKLVFSSTCATFGHPVTETISESHPQNPANTYGRTKLIVEQILKDLSSKNKINAAVLRYFNAAGCSEDGVLGENHEPETHLIPNIILSYLSNFKKPLQIFGNSFATRDGTCVRDYVHVLDLVHAHWEAYNYLQKTPGFVDFNLGTETGTSNLEMIHCFQEIVGNKIPYEFAPARSGDPAYLVASAEKAKKYLNFKTSYTIRDCLLHSLNYLKSRAN